MALNINNDNGTVVADGTEQTIKSESGVGIFILYVNLANMADGDAYEFRCYMKRLSGDSQNYMLFYDTKSNDQGDGAASGSSAAGEVWLKFPPVENAATVVWTLKKTAGANQSFDWREDQIA